MGEQGQMRFALTVVLGPAGKFIPSWQAVDEETDIGPGFGHESTLPGNESTLPGHESTLPGHESAMAGMGPEIGNGPDVLLMEQDMEAAWRKDSLAALLSWGCGKTRPGLSASLSFLVSVGTTFVDALSRHPEVEILRGAVTVPLEPAEADGMLAGSPWMNGMEHLTAEWLRIVWGGLRDAFSSEIAIWGGTVSSWFESHAVHRHLAGRVCFHLVESKQGDAPFAFLATYAQESKTGHEIHGTPPRHLPLKSALQEYARDNRKMLELLSTVQRAAEESRLIRELLDSGDIFHPIGFSTSEAYIFLKEVTLYESAGVLCRVPNWWKGRGQSPRVQIRFGRNPVSHMNLAGLMDFSADLLLGDEPMTVEEMTRLLQEAEGLMLIKGRWQEVDHEKLRETLRVYHEAEKMMLHGGISFSEALHFQLDAERVLRVSGDNAPDVVVTHGEWLKSVLETLSHPEKLEIAEAGSNFHALLRPYQQKGLSWLEGMRRLGLGACLADDMGLGKTVQAIALLNGIRDRSLKTGDGHRTLLVVPASLVGNWTSELDRFAPGIRYHVLHGTLGDKLLPAGPGELPGNQAAESGIRQPDLVITTYGMVTRMKELRATVWDIVILDEAQAIRNPGTLQTSAVKQLQARYRVAMTGTPVENRLSDLWSLFDFLNKGLLGSATEFRAFAAKLEKDRSGYVRLKRAVSPFILRRLKTDRTIIGDLPDKVEVKTFAILTRKQVLLYNQLVMDIQRRLAQADQGMERRGLILAAMMRFKQICNHPDQYLGQQAYEEADSGKMERLRDIGELVRDKRERMLVFTQFREVTEPLSRFLAGVFGCGGLVLHGGTPVKERKKLVDRFQGDEYVPFMVLSIKAGGVGLNLTAANHVVHFDRWWNPAVENQATDRAFRIGQQKNVMVHKFITKGTLEEKIDSMIEDKLRLAGDILPETHEQWLTELDNGRLMDLFRLDMRE